MTAKAGEAHASSGGTKAAASSPHGSRARRGSQTRLLVLAGVGVVVVMMVLVLDPLGLRASVEPPAETLTPEEQALVGTGPKGSVRGQNQGPQTGAAGTATTPGTGAADAGAGASSTAPPPPPPEPGTRRVSPNVPE